MAFIFKQFAVDDSRSAMKVGTDGVLLGAWVDVNWCKSILDIGAGSGLISLMMAQRTPEYCRIKGVEIDRGAYEDCKCNFATSPWRSRLSVENKDFREIDGCYDAIVSNPPFFKDDLKAPSAQRSIARQGDTLNYSTLLEYALKHLNDCGRLMFISDVRHESEIVFKAELLGLKLHRITNVESSEQRGPKRILWDFRQMECVDIDKETFAIRDPNGSWTDRYIELTKDFYLNL